MSMSDELREELQTVRGVGDAKADEIIAIVKANSVDSDVQNHLEQAIDHLDEAEATGNDHYRRYAEKYIRRAYKGDE